MSELPPFRQLQNFIGEKTARQPRKAKAPKPETANEITRKIVQHIRTNGGFSTRIASTGTYRADLKKFVASQQVSGLPDVYGLLDNRCLWVEVKAGRDVLSSQQKQIIAALEKAGAAVYIAHDFDSFQTWFTTEFLSPPF